MDDFDLGGRRLHRESLTERIDDPETDESFVCESTRTTSETADGATETSECLSRVLLACHHTMRPGEGAAVCEACSKKRKRTTLVCIACAVQCPGCGRALCMRHTRPTVYGKRYCRKCLRKLPRKMRGGLARIGNGGLRGWWAWLLEWW